jgi:UDP-3-O-[3-hydroxymyristoyl] glucosamine N-acyltransferase
MTLDHLHGASIDAPKSNSLENKLFDAAYVAGGLVAAGGIYLLTRGKAGEIESGIAENVLKNALHDPLVDSLPDCLIHPERLEYESLLIPKDSAPRLVSFFHPDTRDKWPTTFSEIESETLHRSDSTIISKGAFVHPTARLGEHVYIGRNAFIGPGVHLADGVRVGEFAHISKARIGSEVFIADYAKVGHSPLRDAKDDFFDPEFKKFAPTEEYYSSGWTILGQGVRIGEHTGIGSNVTIDAYSRIENHVEIEEGAQLGNGLAIDHHSKIRTNVIIGNNGRIGAHVELERDVQVGSQVRMNDYANIGARVSIGNGTTLEQRVNIKPDARIGSQVEIDDCTNIGERASVGDGTNIEKRVTVNPCAQIGQYVRIGERSHMGERSQIGDRARLASWSYVRKREEVEGGAYREGLPPPRRPLVSDEDRWMPRRGRR